MSRWGRKPREQALEIVEAAPHPLVPTIPPCENQQIIGEWLASKRSPHTRRAYLQEVKRFLTFVNEKPLNHVTLSDMQTYQASLSGSTASQARHLAAIKSLLTFGGKWYQSFFLVNVGAAIQLDQPEETVAERILPETIIHRLLAAQWVKTGRHAQRNAILLTLLDTTAIRRAELCGLSWRHVQPRKLEDGTETGQITVMGKRNQPRAVLLTPDVWEDLQRFRGNAPDEAPVFASQQRGKKDSAGWKIASRPIRSIASYAKPLKRQASRRW